MDRHLDILNKIQSIETIVTIAGITSLSHCIVKVAIVVILDNIASIN